MQTHQKFGAPRFLTTLSSLLLLFAMFGVMRAAGGGNAFAVASSGSRQQDDGEWETKQRGRVRFAKGSGSTTVRGRIAARVRDQYALRARPGQTMRVTLSSKGGGEDGAAATAALYFDVYVAVGLEALPVTAEDDPPRGAWSGKLPEGDEYYLSVYNPGRGSADQDYELKIELR